MVAETSIRPIRSAKTLEDVEIVIAVLSLQILGADETGREKNCGERLFACAEKFGPASLGQSNSASRRRAVGQLQLQGPSAILNQPAVSHSLHRNLV
jgi:hypothetical protein